MILWDCDIGILCSYDFLMSKHSFQNGGHFLCFSILSESILNICIWLVWPCPPLALLPIRHPNIISRAFRLLCNSNRKPFAYFRLLLWPCPSASYIVVTVCVRSVFYFSVSVWKFNPQASARTPTCWTITEEATNNNVLHIMFLFLICSLSEAHGSQRAEPSAKAWIECYKTESAGYDILLLWRKTWLP